LPIGYGGLQDRLLIANLHREGYLDGLYSGYILSMMALADNNTPKDLLLSVRDDLRPNLMGYHYDNRDEFIDRYREKKYVSV